MNKLIVELYKIIVNYKNNMVDFPINQKREKETQIVYSEDDVLELLHNYRSNFELYRNIQVLPNEFFNWFNKHKKQ